MSHRPTASEYASFYHTYVGKVPEGDLIKMLENQASETLALVGDISDEKGLYRYAEGKWSIKELMCHIIDTERVFAYRALRISRGDTTPLPGFNQDDYVAAFDADARSMASIIEEYQSVRRATITLFKSCTDEMMQRIGTASNSPVSVRALGFIILGHELHHRGILKTRYL